jgi:hypothetical protein
MADVSTTYTLTTPGPDISFNVGDALDSTDKYWITAIRGLDGPSIRAPVDDVPFGDGGLVHTFWKGPRRVLVDGMLLIGSLTNCQVRRNTLAGALESALESIIAADGTLAWNFETLSGTTAQSLTVRNEVPLDIAYTDNYQVTTFSFGLVSAAADPS